MKISLIATVALLSLGCFVVQARVVTMVVNNYSIIGTIVLSNSLSVAANEVAVIRSAYDVNCDYFLIISGTSFQVNSSSIVGKQLAGPAEIRFFAHIADPNSTQCSGYMTVEIKPDSFPPDKTLILPIGTVGVIHLESSTNLIQWQDEWVNTFSNTNQNRFFRIRADRS